MRRFACEGNTPSPVLESPRRQSRTYDFVCGFGYLKSCFRLVFSLSKLSLVNGFLLVLVRRYMLCGSTSFRGGTHELFVSFCQISISVLLLSLLGTTCAKYGRLVLRFAIFEIFAMCFNLSRSLSKTGVVFVEVSHLIRFNTSIINPCWRL